LVYVAECQGLYKIGYSIRPTSRIASLQTATPFPVTLLGTIEGGKEVESWWHHHFKAKRVRGEWFALDAADLALLLASDEFFESPHGDWAESGL